MKLKKGQRLNCETCGLFIPYNHTCDITWSKLSEYCTIKETERVIRGKYIAQFKTSSSSLIEEIERHMGNSKKLRVLRTTLKLVTGK